MGLSERFFVVLLVDTEIETRDDAFIRTARRGIYSFLNAEKRNRFTTLCNDGKDDLVAYKFNRKSETQKKEIKL